MSRGVLLAIFFHHVAVVSAAFNIASPLARSTSSPCFSPFVPLPCRHQDVTQEMLLPNPSCAVHTTSCCAASASRLRPGFQLRSSEKEENETDEKVRELQEEAARIRNEIADFEREKREQEKERMEEVTKQKEEETKEYEAMSAILPILKPDGSTMMERVEFFPRCLPQGNSQIVALQANLPLGIILGQENDDDSGLISVDEVEQEGQGAAAGVQVGDVLRACSACQVQMERPTWQLMAGGIGRPVTRRFMFTVDGEPLEKVMEALASNRMDPDPVWIVVERRTG